jgi:hypothetical protein
VFDVTMTDTPEQVPARWSAARTVPGMWLDPADDPRAEAPEAVGELATHRSYLSHYRRTLELKCEGLDAEQLARRSVPPSTLSLLGLVRHLAKVEHTWFQRVLLEHEELPKLYVSDAEHDADFDGAVADDAVVAEAWETWRREVDAADAWLDTITDADMPRASMHHGEPYVWRDVLEHMVEEYARHLGHADLLRERIDGRVGQ